MEAEAPPPALDRFVADLDAATARQVLLELVKLDMERRGQHQRDPQPVEWYAGRLPALGPVGKLPVDVIYEELQARMLDGPAGVSRGSRASGSPCRPRRCCGCLGGLALSGSPTATYFADTIVEAASARMARRRRNRRAPRTAPFANLQPGDTIDDFQLLSAAGQRRVRPRVSRPAEVDGAAGRPQDRHARRQRAADARPARPPAHRPRVRPAALDRPAGASCCTWRSSPAARCRT